MQPQYNNDQMQAPRPDRNSNQPVEDQYHQPIQPIQYVQDTQPVYNPYIPQIESNTSNFIADRTVLEIINRVHPELAHAMINIAIKKFSESSDFLNYFVRDEYKDIQEEKNSQAVSQDDQKINNSQPETAAAAPAMDFGNW